MEDMENMEIMENNMECGKILKKNPPFYQTLLNNC
jgi:hypothetical protein